MDKREIVEVESYFGTKTPLKFHKTTPNGGHGDLIPISDFYEDVIDGMFIDDDGHGMLSFEDITSNIIVYPSTFLDTLNTWSKYFQFSHVMWYNR